MSGRVKEWDVQPEPGLVVLILDDYIFELEPGLAFDIGLRLLTEGEAE